MNLGNSRLSEEYLNGVEQFLSYALMKTGANEIRCPCVKCFNTYSRSYEMVKSHLIAHGILESYTFWYHHGEKLGESESDEEEDDEIAEDKSEDEIEEIIGDLFPGFNEANDGPSSEAEQTKVPNDEAKKFYRLLKDSEQPLYQGSRCSKLSSLIKLLHIKSLGHWSNESFSMLLQYLKDEMLPKD